MSRRKAWKVDGRWASNDQGGSGGSVDNGTVQRDVEACAHHCAAPSGRQPPKCSSRTGTGIGRAAVARDRPDKHCACSKYMCKAHIEADAFECNWGLEGVEDSRSCDDTVDTYFRSFRKINVGTG